MRKKHAAVSFLMAVAVAVSLGAMGARTTVSAAGSQLARDVLVLRGAHGTNGAQGDTGIAGASELVTQGNGIAVASSAPSTYALSRNPFGVVSAVAAITDNVSVTAAAACGPAAFVKTGFCVSNGGTISQSGAFVSATDLTPQTTVNPTFGSAWVCTVTGSSGKVQAYAECMGGAAL